MVISKLHTNNLKLEQNKLNNIKIIMIYLVVFGHFLGRQPWDNTLAQNLLKIIYVFHMPVFIMTSGYLYGKSKKKYFKHIVNTTLIPFLVFQSIYIVFKGITGEINSLIELLKEIITPGSVNWYILCLFYWKIIIKKVKKNKITIIILLILPIITGVVPFISYEFALARALNYFIYFYLGYIAYNKEFMRNYYKYNNKKLSFLTLAILILFLTLINKVSVYEIQLMTSYSQLGMSIIYGMINRIYIYILGFIISIFIIIKMSSKEYKFTYLGGKTISIYFLHNYFIYAFLLTGIYNKIFVGNIGVIAMAIVSVVVTIILGSKLFIVPTNKVIDIFKIKE